MRKFCDELWRIAKFLVISFVVGVPISYLYSRVHIGLIASNSSPFGAELWLSLVNYAYLFLINVVTTLANRYFTFRATEKWYIAVPIMVGAQFLWNLLGNFSITLTTTRGTMESLMMAAQIQSVLWVIVSYLLQRCVIYCHTLDTNGWYRRFHPTYDEEGENSDEQECNPGD